VERVRRIPYKRGPTNRGPTIDLARRIRQKLLNLAEERNEDFGLVLTKYGHERTLFRLSKPKCRAKPSRIKRIYQ
jgi:tRNA(Ile)-lysidine synthase TilS/MesJ